MKSSTGLIQGWQQSQGFLLGFFPFLLMEGQGAPRTERYHQILLAVNGNKIFYLGIGDSDWNKIISTN